MQQKTLAILEYEKIKLMLQELTVSSCGYDEAQHLQIYMDIETIRSHLHDTAEAEWYLAREGAGPILAFSDIRSSLIRSMKGSTLSNKELLDAAGALRASRNVYDALESKANDFPRLSRLAAELCSDKKTENEIYRCILSIDEIADDASAELSSIRKRMKILAERMRQKLQSMIHSTEFKKYLQDPIVTIRNDRYVLPVKQEYRSMVPGMLHDQSASGATLFIEPTMAMESNNEMKKLALDEHVEIEKILARLTGLIATVAEQLAQSIEALGKLDFIFAKGALSRKMHAVEPLLNADGIIELNDARHPLIQPEQVVPISLKLGGDIKGLIITGPNTGGKTVTLKTVGLFVLMAQSGLHIPARSGARIGVFEQVFADIGDEQSIEQSLSTFSSHMGNVINILNEANDRSLVLLDELGAGTDPAEGAALAMALLDELYDRNATVMATTHYGQLKAYAMNKQGLENASMEFDVKSLRPTFRLLMGIPGRSNAFEISQRLGLGKNIIETAKGYLEGGKVSFEELISKAEKHRQTALEERREAETARKEADKLKAETESTAKQQQEKIKKTLEKAKEEARSILMNAQEQAEEAIEEIKRASKENEAQRTRSFQTGRKVLDEALNEVNKDDLQDEEYVIMPEDEIKEGATVYLPRYRQSAVVIEPPDEKREVLLLAGSMRLNLPVNEISYAVKSSKKTIQPRSTVMLQPKQVAMELHLRHMTLDEAIPELDKYLDDAFICGLKQVSIIHGKGSGTLRNAVREHLRTHPHIKSFRGGKYGEGEAGVTIAELK